MNNFEDALSGKTIGRLLVSRVHSRGGSGRHASYECLCECGNTVVIRSTTLRKATEERSCGMCTEFIAGNKRDAKLLYAVWYAMIYRCHKTSIYESKWLYDRYRKRGISVCTDWRYDFRSFMKWSMANGWSRGLTIDRVDNDLGYYPENCRFVTRQENTNNREVTIYVSYPEGSEERPLADVVREHSVVSHKLAFQRHFEMGWTLHRALTTPARQGNYK
jgi:hypothetical protein